MTDEQYNQMNERLLIMQSQVSEIQNTVRKLFDYMLYQKAAMAYIAQQGIAVAPMRVADENQ